MEISTLIFVFLFFLLPVFLKLTLLWLYLWQKKEYRLDRMLAYFNLLEAKKLILDFWFWIKIFNLLALILWLFLSFTVKDYSDNYSFSWMFWAIEGFEYLTKVIIKREIVKPVFTKKIQLLFVLNILFLIFVLGLTYPILNTLFGSIIWQFYFVLTPFIIFISITLLKPVENIYKKRLFEKTKLYRESLKNLKVIAISGAFGKSSTKEILFQLLGNKFETDKTFEFENVDLAVAKKVLDLKSTTSYFLAELGSYKIGEGSSICKFIKPTTSVITGLNLQHLALFGTVENIIQAESESLSFLPKESKVYINYNSELCSQIKVNTNLNLIKYGITLAEKSDKFDVYASNIIFEENHTSFVFNYKKQKFKLITNLETEGDLQNLVVSLAIFLDEGGQISEIEKQLNKLTLPNNTLNKVKIGRQIIFDDTHNSNYDGIINSFKLLQNYQNKGYKSYLILDDILELGSKSYQVHNKIALNLLKIKPDKVFLIGRNFANYIEKILLKNNYPNQNVIVLKNNNFEKIKQLISDLNNLNKKSVFVFQGFQAKKYLFTDKEIGK